MQITRSAGRSGDHMLIDSWPSVTEQSASLIAQDLINLWACVLVCSVNSKANCLCDCGLEFRVCGLFVLKNK